METVPKVAIIILNWNGFDDTLECLESLKSASYRNYIIIIVDNGSRNNEGRRLKELFPYIHLIENTANRGFAGGTNDGINWALVKGCDYIVTLNNDCIVSSDWLSNLVNGMLTSNSDFATSRIMFYPNKDFICSDGDLPLLDGSAIPENAYKPFIGLGEIRPIVSACAAASIYSAECLRAVKIKEDQYFDELYFAYLEDVDLCLRMNAKSYKGVLIPNAVVYHKYSKTACSYPEFTTFHCMKNRILNMLLNYPIYLIVIGEVSYFIEKFLGDMYRKITADEYTKKIGIIRMLILSIKARFWVVSHISLILKDRWERESKGLIDKRIDKMIFKKRRT